MLSFEDMTKNDYQIFQGLDVVELECLTPEHGGEDVVRVVDDTQTFNQALLPTRKLSRHQQVLLVAGVKGFLQIAVLRSRKEYSVG